MKNFSVLQSVYRNDKPEYLDECFSSIFNSTLLPQKIVLVKDGPVSEELEKVISKWQKQLPLQVAGYEQNQGLAHALNYGLQFVETELVARMDSDDFCDKDRFMEQVSCFESNSEIDVLGCGLNEFYIDSVGNKKSKIRMYPELVNKTSKCLFKGTPLGHPTVMMKTEILRSFKYSEDTSMNEDIDLWFRLLKSDYEIHNIQKPLLNFRITDGTFRRRSIKKAFNEFRIYWKSLKNFFGCSMLLVYPLCRLFIRFLPYSVSKFLYFSNFRKKLFS